MKETSQQPSDELNRAPQPSRAKQFDTLPGALAGIIKLERLSKADVLYVIALTIASLIAYVLTYYILEPFVNRPNDLLGGMWATIATVFVSSSRPVAVSCSSCRLTLLITLPSKKPSPSSKPFCDAWEPEPMRRCKKPLATA